MTVKINQEFKKKRRKPSSGAEQSQPEQMIIFMFQGASQREVPFVSLHGHLCVQWCAYYSLRLHVGDKVCVFFKI